MGIRPTPGITPNHPTPLLWDAGQVHGPLARTAEDAALVLDTMIGVSRFSPISVAPPWPSALAEVDRCKDARGLRIAYASDIAGIGVDVEIDAICRQAARQLQDAGAIVEEVAFDASDGRDPLFERFDLLLTPAAPVKPYPVEMNFPNEINGRKFDNYIDWIAPAFLITLVSLPAGSVPAGKTRDGLPVGLQIVAPRFEEPRILSLAKLVQQAHPIGWPPES